MELCQSVFFLILLYSKGNFNLMSTFRQRSGTLNVMHTFSLMNFEFSFYFPSPNIANLLSASP